VQAGDTLAIIESMKMEIAVTAPAGSGCAACRQPGRTVAPAKSWP
jgi:biotin carboxyl carrier protein